MGNPAHLQKEESIKNYEYNSGALAWLSLLSHVFDI